MFYKVFSQVLLLPYEVNTKTVERVRGGPM